MEKEELQRYIGQTIKNLRESKKMTQLDLASACNIERSNLARIESGNTNPTIYSLYTIAEALGVSLSELLEIE